MEMNPKTPFSRFLAMIHFRVVFRFRCYSYFIMFLAFFISFLTFHANWKYSSLRLPSPRFILIFLWMFPLLVTTGDHSSPPYSAHCVVFYNHHMHILLKYIHKPSLTSSWLPPAGWICLHPPPYILLIPPPCMDIILQPRLSSFVPTLTCVRFPSNVLSSNFVQPRHS